MRCGSLIGHPAAGVGFEDIVPGVYDAAFVQTIRAVSYSENCWHICYAVIPSMQRCVIH